MVEHSGKPSTRYSHRLKTPPHISPQIHSLTILRKKIDIIRESTKDTPMPDLSTLPPPAHSLCKFDELTTAEVEKLISDSSTKQCELDSAPVWLLKSLHTVFAPILALLINVSLTQASLPTKHKRAIIRPRINYQETGTRSNRPGQLSSHLEPVFHLEAG